MATVLLVTGNAALADFAAQNLNRSGHEVALAKQGTEALQALQATSVDAIALDVALATLDANGFCQRLQENPRWQPIPVVFLAPPAARWLPGSLPLRTGQDGLVCQPITWPALREELDRVLAGRLPSRLVSLAHGVTLEYGSQEVMGPGGVVSLTPTEFRLLAYLAQRPAAFTSSEELLEKVWEFYPGTGSAELVRSHISNVRAKLRLASGGKEVIRTVPRKGYRLG